MNPQRAPSPLLKLAELYGVESVYVDVEGTKRHASAESLIGVLRSLGAPLESVRDAPEALRTRRLEHARAATEPIAIAWDGIPPRIYVRSSARNLPDRVKWEIHWDDGEVSTGETQVESVRATDCEVEGERTERCSFGPRPDGGLFRWGRHSLLFEIAGHRHSVHIISAPKRAFPPAAKRSWGIFAPTYALRSERTIGGCGDLGDLETLIQWVGDRGGAFVGTLPLLPTFLDEPFDPSPYAPVTRLFWNELYLDIGQLPELSRSSEVRHRLDSKEFRDTANRLWKDPLVDYRGQHALRKPIVDGLARVFFENAGDETQEFHDFLKNCPRALEYAGFRAKVELDTPRPRWSPEQRRDWHYHVYSQFRLSQQLDELSIRAQRIGVGLYLDLPLGVHPQGYDAWAEREQFLSECAVGSPPDPFFALGQNWGFAPLHPEVIRKRHYDYVAEALRQGLRVAGALRIDHVMSLHRVFCIPKGMDAKDGVYVRFPAEELYALLSLESHRHRCMLVGEDLGTVPDEVPVAMRNHAVRQMYVVQYEANPDPTGPLKPVPRNTVASLNTHDMAPFTAFWRGDDIRLRMELGLLRPDLLAREEADRQTLREALLEFYGVEGHAGREEEEVLRAALRFLAASPADLVLINLEDLWLERDAQNVPGTDSVHPNWRRKLRLTLEEVQRRSITDELLREVVAVRGKNREKGS